jgi:predicted membrane channel-forming protein YqfA (hemolysin III family)
MERATPGPLGDDKDKKAFTCHGADDDLTCVSTADGRGRDLEVGGLGIRGAATPRGFSTLVASSLPGLTVTSGAAVRERTGAAGGHQRKVGLMARDPSIGVLPVGHPLHRPFIRGGYRLHHGTLDAALSVFRWHNDTINIWSHLLGLVWWVRMLVQVTSGDTYESADEATRALWVASYALCCMMPLMSTLYHIFGTSRAGACQTNCFRLDLTGILMLWSARVAMEGWIVLWCERALYINYIIVAVVMYAFVVPTLIIKVKRPALRRSTSYVVHGVHV